VVEFFSHGVRHLPEETRERIKALQAGKRLYLMQDIQNPSDAMALMMRTGNPVYYVGYCYTSDIRRGDNSSPRRLNKVGTSPCPSVSFPSAPPS
jgi:hypothetical protein